MSKTTYHCRSFFNELFAQNSFYLLVFLLFLSNFGYTQSWFNTYPRTSESEALLPTADGGYIITGRSGDPNITINDNAFLLKVDVDGRQQWFTEYGGAERDDAKDLILGHDGNYLLSGSSNSFGNGADIFVVKADQDGNELWQTNFGPDNSSERANDLLATNDGAYLVTGCLSCFTNGSAYLVKFDEDGNELWAKSYPQAVEALQVENLPDGYLIAAILDNTQINLLSEIILIKTDFDGEVVWTKNYGSTANSLDVRAIIPLTDGIILSGTRKLQNQNNTDAYLFKVDFNGDSLWIRNYGDPLEGDNVFSASLTQDNNISIAGLTFQNGNGDYFFLTTDLDGNQLSFNTFGGPAEETSKGILSHPNGSFTITGIQRSFNGNQISNSSALLIHTDNQGLMVDGVIRGRVFIDTNNSCSDDGEDGTSDWIISANNGTEEYFARPSQDGFYEIQVPTGTYTVEAFGIENWQSCIPPTQITLSTPLDTTTLDFPMQVQFNCAVLQVDLATASLVRCVDNSYTVKYCNRGTTTATGAWLELYLPDEISISNSSNIFSSLGNQRFRFDLGNISPGTCDDISLNLLLDCNSTTTDATYCIEAKMFPQTSCLPTDPSWDNSSITLAATCENDTVQFRVQNIGVGTMTKSQQLIIIEDDIVSRTTRFQLTPGEELALPVYLPGTTIRVQAEQTEGHPGESKPSIAVEACGSNNMGSFSRGFVNQFPEDDGDLFIAKDCRESIDTPNGITKFTFPKGKSTQHFIPANTDLEYLVTYRNTSSDTIRSIIFRDSLSEWLDPRDIELGACSHPVKLELLYNGLIKLSFDSLVLLPSQAVFVQYRLSQQIDNSPGTVIQNKTEIIIDNQPAVLSTPVFHTIARNEIYQTLSLPICDREEWLGIEIREDTLLRDTLSMGNSDSIRIFNIDHIPVEVDIQQIEICRGDSLQIGSSVYTTQGIYLDTLSYQNYNCDSLLLATDLRILEIERIVNDTTIQQGDFFRDIRIVVDTTVIDTLIAQNGCDSLNITNIFTTTVSTNGGYQADFNIEVFPIPLQQQLSIHLNGKWSGKVNLRLLSIQGKTIRSIRTETQNIINLPVQDLSTGMYLLEVTGNDRRFTFKLIKR